MQLTPNDLWCDPEPFRAHVEALMADTGLHWRLLAARAELAPRVMSRLLRGTTRRLHCTVGRALVTLDLDDLAEDEQRLVPALDSRHLLEALQQLGHDPHHLPFVRAEDAAVIDGRQACPAATRTRIRAAHDLIIEQLRPLASMTIHASEPAASQHRQSA